MDLGFVYVCAPSVESNIMRVCVCVYTCPWPLQAEVSGRLLSDQVTKVGVFPFSSVACVSASPSMPQPLSPFLVTEGWSLRHPGLFLWHQDRPSLVCLSIFLLFSLHLFHTSTGAVLQLVHTPCRRLGGMWCPLPWPTIPHLLLKTDPPATHHPSGIAHLDQNKPIHLGFCPSNMNKEKQRVLPGFSRLSEVLPTCTRHPSSP